jgi:hypothetical protein
MKRPRHAYQINGKPVVNAKRKLVLHISAADIKAAKSKDPALCAAARAAMRVVPNCIAARVHLGRAYILQKNVWHRFKTPEPLRGEIIAYDRGGKFEPGDYELCPMSPSDMKGHRATYTRSETNRATPGNPPQKNPRKLHVVKGVRRRSTMYSQAD